KYEYGYSLLPTQCYPRPLPLCEQAREPSFFLHRIFHKDRFRLPSIPPIQLQSALSSDPRRQEKCLPHAYLPDESQRSLFSPHSHSVNSHICQSELEWKIRQTPL